jgi:hypothetical protein
VVKKSISRQGQRGGGGREMAAEIIFMNFGIDYSIGRVRGDDKSCKIKPSPHLDHRTGGNPKNRFEHA